MTRLWAWLVAALGFMAAALLLVIGQRDRARQQARQAQAGWRAADAARDAEQTLDRAREAARRQAEEVRRDAEDRPDDHRPGGHLRR